MNGKCKQGRKRVVNEGREKQNNVLQNQRVSIYLDIHGYDKNQKGSIFRAGMCPSK